MHSGCNREGLRWAGDGVHGSLRHGWSACSSLTVRLHHPRPRRLLPRLRDRSPPTHGLSVGQVELLVALDAADPLYDEKAEFLRMGGIKPEMAFPLLIDRYSSELSEFLRLCCVRPGDTTNLGDLAYNEPLSIANEKATLTALREGCVLALSEYPQSEEEDAKLMGDGFMFSAL